MIRRFAISRQFPVLSSRPRVRRGLTLADLCVLIVIVAFSGAVLIPRLSADQREAANRIKCAANLRALGQRAFIYANAERSGRYPRLYWKVEASDKPTFYTGVDTKASFDLKDPRPDGPALCDVTGAFYLILKNTDTTPDMFICPSGDATRLKPGLDPLEKSNFPGRANLSYSYNNPYPTKEAVMGGWKFDPNLGTEYPLASDMNFGDTDAGGPTKVSVDSDRKLMATANSANHQFAGQNVVYVDAHIEWQPTPFCGVQRAGKAFRDNIFATFIKDVDAKGKGGTVLGGAQDAQDAVLLPTYQDGPQPKEPAPRKLTADSIADAPAKPAGK